MEYLVPDDVSAALEMMTGGVTAVAGGTDFYPAHVGRPITRPVVDIAGLSELRGITRMEDSYRLGALTRWTDVAGADLPRGFDGLRAAAREVGSIQIQNTGTIGGNICNASPAADGIPSLLTLDASVELTSISGSRVLPLEEFLIGYRQTALRPDELLSAVVVPRGLEDAFAVFLKLGLRRYLVISVVMVAAVVAVDPDGRIARARVAVGACSPIAKRLRSLEVDLVGRSIDEDMVSVVNQEHLSELSPIDDVRASAGYRREATLALVRRALVGCRGAQ